jgi:hypothetical protein
VSEYAVQRHAPSVLNGSSPAPAATTTTSPALAPPSTLIRTLASMSDRCRANLPFRPRPPAGVIVEILPQYAYAVAKMATLPYALHGNPCCFCELKPVARKATARTNRKDSYALRPGLYSCSLQRRFTTHTHRPIARDPNRHNAVRPVSDPQGRIFLLRPRKCSSHSVCPVCLTRTEQSQRRMSSAGTVQAGRGQLHLLQHPACPPASRRCPRVKRSGWESRRTV